MNTMSLKFTSPVIVVLILTLNLVGITTTTHAAEFRVPAEFEEHQAMRGVLQDNSPTLFMNIKNTINQPKEPTKCPISRH